MRVFIAGVDGYIGWALAQYLVYMGHEVSGGDNLTRRDWVSEVGGFSIVPVASFGDRVEAFKKEFGMSDFFFMDFNDYEDVERVFRKVQPDAIVHLAEMPSAPYSMIDAEHAVYTQCNNVGGTLNMLYAIREACQDAHLVKLGCFDDKTEVLTEDGFKFFKDLTFSDKVCTLDKHSETISYTHPTDIMSYFYKGKMLRLTHKSIDLLVTPNHRVVYKKDEYKKLSGIKIDKAEDIFGSLLRIPCSGEWLGVEKDVFEIPEYINEGNTGIGCRKYLSYRKQVKMDDWLEFFGRWVSEGSVYIKRKEGEKNGSRVSISQKNDSKLEEIKEVINRLGYTFYQHDKKDGTCTIIIENAQLASYLSKFGNPTEKYIPRELKLLSKRQLNILFTSMMGGDDSYRIRNNKKVPVSYCTKSKRLSDDFQEVVLKLGLVGTNTKSSKDGCYYISVARETNRTVDPKVKRKSGKKTYEWEDYEGMVYCCSVDSSIVLVRRNGMVCWSGNSMGEYGYFDLDIPEGFFEIEYKGRKSTVPFPKRPGSYYHLSKLHDTHNIMFACDTWDLRSTDIMQGIVYGSSIKEMVDLPEFKTRLDVDACFGTVLNRFCAQAVLGTPLTLYGEGKQKRGFLPLEDSVQCLTIAIQNPPDKGEYRVFNQFEEVYCLNDIADKVVSIADEMGIKSEIVRVKNPRKELEDHYYKPEHRKLLELGYKPSQNLKGQIINIMHDMRVNLHRLESIRNVLLPNILW